MLAKAKRLFGPNKLIDLVLLMGDYAGNFAGTAALLAAVDMELASGQEAAPAHSVNAADQASTVCRTPAMTVAGGLTSLNTAKLSGVSGMTGKRKPHCAHG